MKTRLIFFFHCFVGIATLAAQHDTTSGSTFPDSLYTVDNVIIIGNDITKTHIIENEMSLHRGDSITHEAVEFNKERIYSLRLFTKVEIDVVPETKETATLIVRVHERWFFYPYPVIGIKDHSFSKIYYGAGLIHNNVGGKNVLMFGQFAAGYDPFISFGYADPLFGQNKKIYFSTHVYYTEQRNRSLVSLQSGPNFDESRWGADISLGKRYSLYSSITSTLEYLDLRVTDNRSGRTLSETGRDNFFSFSSTYRYDTRDLADYARLGTYLSVSISKIGIFDKTVNYQRYNLDFRRFIPIVDDMIVAGRVFSSIAAGGNVPNYGHTFFGYNERIRGYFSKILEGEQIAGSTIEFHFPIIKPSYIRIEQIPIEQFRDIRYALNFAIFADAGNTWYRKDPIALNKFRSGYGFGFHVNLAYSAVGRIEYAIPYGSPFSKGEIILDIGASI